MTQPRELTYADELLADGTVHRRYADGRSEWRRRRPDGRVEWQDDRNDSGTDERLGEDLVKRTHADGRVEYGRDIGYGRTVWGRGELVLVNRSAFGGRLGVVLGVLGQAAAGVPAAQLPPQALTPDEEEELRRRARERQPAGSPGGGGEGEGGTDPVASDWEDGDDWHEDDFG
ncbi:hypothetical protein [Kitasatospora camelliae]|uniref:Uncharacterized protein n=1 Tax=Kitasatospora camelliae TaxID=3156397 RepID=A0AAU8JQR9_9ACTN